MQAPYSHKYFIQICQPQKKKLEMQIEMQIVFMEIKFTIKEKKKKIPQIKYL